MFHQNSVRTTGKPMVSYLGIRGLSNQGLFQKMRSYSLVGFPCQFSCVIQAKLVAESHRWSRKALELFGAAASQTRSHGAGGGGGQVGDWHWKTGDSEPIGTSSDDQGCQIISCPTAPPMGFIGMYSHYIFTM